jgi:hypothetical protein
MADHASLSPTEAADRLAIPELFDAYAHCADRRGAEAQKALCTVDTRFAVFMSGEGTEPTYVVEGREALTPIFADLNQYEATTHFNGQSTVALNGDHATGESYTFAHHLFTADGERKIMIASLRYLDSFVKIEGTWFFEERNLILDWSETRSSTPSTMGRGEAVVDSEGNPRPTRWRVRAPKWQQSRASFGCGILTS